MKKGDERGYRKRGRLVRSTESKRVEEGDTRKLNHIEEDEEEMLLNEKTRESE